MKGEIAPVGYGEYGASEMRDEGAGRWNEIKRGEATRLKGKAGTYSELNGCSVGCSRRHLYSRKIVIDRSTERLCRARIRFPPFLYFARPFFLPSFIFLPEKGRETAREHRHLSRRRVWHLAISSRAHRSIANRNQGSVIVIRAWIGTMWDRQLLFRSPSIRTYSRCLWHSAKWK